MSKQLYVTRKIPDVGLAMLREKGFLLDINPEDRPLSQGELKAALAAKQYDGVLCQLGDAIDASVFTAAPSVKIYANYAVGFNNIDIEEAKKRGITVTNTPGVLNAAVAEHTMALMLALMRRIVESDRYLREGNYKGWAPELLLGEELSGKKLGIVGAGRIGALVAKMAMQGFGMLILYYDLKRSEEFEKESHAVFRPTLEELLKEADVLSLHVPLLPSTTHLINEDRLMRMKKTAYLINTSRGAVIDEAALVKALQKGVIKGAALDVFEHEPELTPGLAELSNVVLTPHTASATRRARDGMAKLAAENLIAFFEGKTPPNKV